LPLEKNRKLEEIIPFALPHPLIFFLPILRNEKEETCSCGAKAADRPKVLTTQPYSIKRVEEDLFPLLLMRSSQQH